MILRNDPIDEYHGRLRGDPPTYSHTSLRYGAEHGWRALRMLQQGEITIDDKKEFAFGRLFEDRLCKGREWFDAATSIRPEGIDLRTKEGKEWAKSQAGRIAITADDARMIEDMVAAIMEIPEARAIVETFEQQVTLSMALDGMGELWAYAQVKPDFLKIVDSQAITVNLKTAAVLDKITSGRGIADFGYHTSMGLERIVARANGIEITQCFDLVVEKSYPSRAALVELSPMFVDLGEFTVSRWLDRVRECHETGVWPRADQTSFVAEPPAWLTKDR